MHAYYYHIRPLLSTSGMWDVRTTLVFPTSEIEVKLFEVVRSLSLYPGVTPPPRPSNLNAPFFRFSPRRGEPVAHGIRNPRVTTKA